MAKRRIPGLLSSLSERLSGSAAVEGGERGDAESSGAPRAERPVGRSILWVPRGRGAYEVERPRRYDLFVEQDVLREACDHALDEEEGSYGLLAGRLLRCRRTRLPYVHVESAHRADHALPAGEDLTSFRECFWKVRERVSRRGRQVVGWYHTHSLLGLQLSERDRRLHVAHFQEEWACALVVVTQRGRQEGGFFQRDRGDILFRRAILPFYEIIKQKVRPGGGPYVTWIAWDNYRTGAPVLHARKPVTVRPTASADASTTKLLTRERARGPRRETPPKDVPEAPRVARRKFFGAAGRPTVPKASIAARGSGKGAPWQEWKESAAARLATEQEAARQAAEEEAARLAAEEEAARLAVQEEEAARLAAEQEAARLAAEEEEAARLAAEEEAARLAAEQEAVRLAAAEEEAARLVGVQEAVRLAAAQEAARLAVRLAAADEVFDL
ncbi:MAG: hypothetical protein V3W35_03065, partial [Gemmatimonadota bacterium]